MSRRKGFIVFFLIIVLGISVACAESSTDSFAFLDSITFESDVDSIKETMIEHGFCEHAWASDSDTLLSFENGQPVYGVQPGYVWMTLENNILYEIMVRYEPNTDNFATVKDALTSRYGNPDLNNTQRENDVMYSWKTSDVQIFLGATGGTTRDRLETAQEGKVWFAVYIYSANIEQADLPIEESPTPTPIATPMPTPATGDDFTTAEFVFRNGIKFGMTMQEVRELEEAEPYYITDGVIIYDGVKAAGKAAEVFYLFENNSLDQIGIFFTESHTNENLYINDFEDVDNSLRAKYGDPIRDSEQFWSANTYKNDPDRWGFAVSIGDLVYGTEYMPTNYPNLWIKHVLQGDNYEFTHMLSYEYSDGTEEHIYNTDGI